MIFAVDVGYQADTALATGVLVDRGSAPLPTAAFTLPIRHVADDEPRQFDRRELPCILELLMPLTAPDFPLIQPMPGDHRIPTRLKWVDRLTRSG
jgi:deoxyinosine 3'endonuclease (endonuclease V)